MLRSLLSSRHSVLQVSEAILLRFGSSSSKHLARCGHIPPCSMATVHRFFTLPRFFAPRCRLCSSRSSWPFGHICDDRTQLCLYCLGARRDAFWLRLYSLPRLDASTNLHIASCLHNNLRHIWRRAYAITICIQVRESPFQLLIWTRGGDAILMSDGREVVDLVLDFLV